MKKLKLSIIITAKDLFNSKLRELKRSIDRQTYPAHLYEVLIITNGTAESAKGIGLKKAKGEIICFMASDNYLNDNEFISKCMKPFEDKLLVGAYPIQYYYNKSDGSLNRYFSLMGCNDPVAFYLKKKDRYSYLSNHPKKFSYWIEDIPFVSTIGDNGFFIRKKILMQADIEYYFHIDVCQDLFDKGYKTYALVNTTIWHRTGGNFFKFFAKRFKYADQFSENRRWHMVTRRDIPKLALFILYTLTLVQPLYVSFKGYRKVKDVAWFMHLPVCWATLITYSLLVVKRCLYRLLSRRVT